MKISQTTIEQGLLWELAYLRLESYKSYKDKEYATLEALMNSGNMGELARQ